MKITIFQHVPFEGPGLITKWARKNGQMLEIVRIFENQPFPLAEQISFLIILGGPMSAKDQDSWLQEERELIKKVVTQNKPMLGICLGGQQLAYAFGGEIVNTPKEVGWGEIFAEADSRSRFDAESCYRVLHWHGEGFVLPEGAVSLFHSPDWKNQGFRYRKAIGLQFHLETTTATLRELVQKEGHFLSASLFEQSTEQVLTEQISSRNQTLLFTILDELMAESEQK